MAASPLPDWHGRDDTSAEGGQALRWHQMVSPWHPSVTPGFVITGFACDEGVRRNQGRVGAALGPPALRRTMSNLAWHHSSSLYDAGDVSCVDSDMEHAQQELGCKIAEFIFEGHRPIVLGGGHETAWGTFLGIKDHLLTRKVGIINLDAHFDLRESSLPHSGTPFAQMATWCKKEQRPIHYLCAGVSEAANTAGLFQRAMNLNAVWIKDEDLTASKLSAALSLISEFMLKVDLVYLSIDLDVLPVSIMRAVSAPAAFGVALDVVLQLIECIAMSGKLLVTDVVEYNPLLDLDQSSSRVAARLIWNLIRHWRPLQEHLS